MEEKTVKPSELENLKDMKLTYNENMYYINASGVVCQYPDQLEGRADVRDAFLEDQQKIRPAGTWM